MGAKAQFKKIVCIFVILCLLMPFLVQIGTRVRGNVGESLVARAAGGLKGKPIEESSDLLARAAGGIPGKPGGGGGGGGGGTPTNAKVALCIGISNYDGTMYDLKYCDDDAQDWSGYLKNKGYTVHTLIDSQATGANILSEIDWLNSAETSAADTVVFVYAGHGIKQGGSGSNIISRDFVYISQSQLDSKFSSFASQKIFFFFDACQIGGMTTLGGTGRFVACASTSTSYAYDGTSSMANGVFTYYFLEDGIKQKGYTAMEDAFDYAEYMSEKNYPMNCVSSDGYSGLMYL